MEKTITKSYYAIIPAYVRYDKDLPLGARLLYGEISALCNEKGYCWATNAYFAELYQVSKVTISKWISALADREYIYIKIIRDENDKQILERNIYIDDTPIKENFNTYLRKVNDPIKENFKENNTFNNNICPSDDEQVSDDSLKEAQLAEDFDKIWINYPRKDGKNTAFRHYKAWINGKKYAGKTVKLTNKQMWYAVVNYAKEIEEKGTEERYIKMGSTFFNEAIMEYVSE